MIKRFQEAEKFDVIELGKLRNLCHETWPSRLRLLRQDWDVCCARVEPWPSVAIHGHRHPWPLVARQVDTERDGAEQLSIAGGMATAICFPPRKSI